MRPAQLSEGHPPARRTPIPPMSALAHPLFTTTLSSQFDIEVRIADWRVSESPVAMMQILTNCVFYGQREIKPWLQQAMHTAVRVRERGGLRLRERNS